MTSPWVRTRLPTVGAVRCDACVPLRARCGPGAVRRTMDCLTTRLSSARSPPRVRETVDGGFAETVEEVAPPSALLLSRVRAVTMALMRFEMMTSPLRWRRRWYAARAKGGFGGGRTGSWQHALRSVSRPWPTCSLSLPIRATCIVLLWSAVWAGVVLTGVVAARSAAATATAAVVLSWLIAGIVSFAIDVRRIHQRPPFWPQPDAGVREPRR
jgi:hypothetical protein